LIPCFVFSIYFVLYEVRVCGVVLTRAFRP